MAYERPPNINDFSARFLRGHAWAHNDFGYDSSMSPSITSQAVLGDFLARVSGTGSSIAPPATGDSPFASHPGYLLLNTGTATSGEASVSYGPFALGSGLIRIGAWIQSPPQLSDGTNTYFLSVGMFNTGSFTPQALGNDVAFLYKHDINSGAWQGSSEDSAQSDDALDDNGGAITVATSTWYLLEMEVAADASTVQFFIDGVSKGVISTAANIPDGLSSSDDMSFYAGIRKTAGTTSRQMKLDAMYFYQEFSTQR